MCLLGGGGAGVSTAQERVNCPLAWPHPVSAVVESPIDELFMAEDGLATTAQLLSVMTRKQLDWSVRTGRLVRVWHGIYARQAPTVFEQLEALDRLAGQPIVGCMNTAAAIYGFDVNPSRRLHVLDPGVRMRPSSKLMVHQRIGAPIRRVGGRLMTSPAWTAIELARTLSRPRALALLDLALRTESCTRTELSAAIEEQKGRRGIVHVRELLPHADPRAESAMESETRLVFIDSQLPMPHLQSEIVDLHGDTWRVDFFWEDGDLIGEYDSEEWHANPAAFRRDRHRTARLQECGSTVMPITADDVRLRPLELIGRVYGHLRRASSGPADVYAHDVGHFYANFATARERKVTRRRVRRAA